ncbi:MAG: hypothetical protein QXK37_06350 [Candidatus Woesearchaeota archaeon]
MAKADLDSYCDSLCAQAHRSLKDKVTYCTSYYRGEIDINKNSIPDFTMALDNIQGYCEDRIYCAAYRPCGSLDMLTCKKITCDYIERNLGAGNSDVTKSNRLVHYNPDSDTYSGYFQPGECWSRLSSEERENHWFYHFMSVPDYMGKTSDSKCFFRWGTCLETASALQTEYDTNTWQADCIPPSGDI